MAAEQPQGFLSSEDHSRTENVAKDAISFHEYKRRIEKHFSREQNITALERWKKCIKGTLGVLKHRPSRFAIYRVPSKLLKVEEDAYIPRMVSIGPFHHGREDLLKMEEHKWRYMLFLIGRTLDPVKTVEKCGEAIGSLQQRVPGYYAEDLNMTRNKLMEILLVDACFILELFIRYLEAKKDDEIMGSARMISTIKHDLVLLENQIPFFVIRDLFRIVESSIGEPFPYSLTQYALGFFDLALNSLVLAVPKNPRPAEARHLNNARHLLEMLHIFYRPPFSEADPKVDHHVDTLGFKHCATNLLESGIELKMGLQNCFQLEILFNDGEIQFPPLSIDETMETIFRNLIAFEQCSVGGTHHITSYLMLIQSLIASPQDFNLLQEKKIIRKSQTCGKDVVSTFFNSICSEINIFPKDFYFVKLCEDVNKYSQSWWHYRRIKAYLGVQRRKCMDSLKNDYFPNPWSFISFAAAVVLILLTFLQTLYTIRP